MNSSPSTPQQSSTSTATSVAQHKTEDVSSRQHKKLLMLKRTLSPEDFSKLTTLMHRMKAGQCTKQQFDEEYKELIIPYGGAFTRYMQQQVQATQQQENAADGSPMNVIVDESSSSSSASAPSPPPAALLMCQQALSVQVRQPHVTSMNMVDQQRFYQLQQATGRNGAASSHTTPPPIFMNGLSPFAFASTSSISPSVARPVPSSKVATPRRHHPYVVSGAYSSRIRTRNQALKMLSTLQPSFKLVQTEGGFTMKIEAFIAHEKIETFHAPEFSEEEYEEQEKFYASFKRLSPEEQAVKYKEKSITPNEVLAIWDTIKPRQLSKLCNQFKDIDSDTIDHILTEHQSYELAVKALTDINLK